MSSQAIELGKPVISRDGKRIGKVDRLVIDVDTREVTAIIVHQGVLLSQDRIVERTLIDRIDQDGTVHLSVTAAEAEQLPLFVEAEFRRVTEEELHTLPYAVPSALGGAAILWSTPLSGQPVPELGAAVFTPAPEAAPPSPAITVERNVSPDALLISKGTHVVASDGKDVGRVEEVVVNEDGEVAEIIAEAGWLGRRLLRIPRSWIASLTETTVTLSVTREELESSSDLTRS